MLIATAKMFLNGTAILKQHTEVEAGAWNRGPNCEWRAEPREASGKDRTPVLNYRDDFSLLQWALTEIKERNEKTFPKFPKPASSFHFFNEFWNNYKIY